VKIYKYYYEENNFYLASTWRTIGKIYLENYEYDEAEKILRKVKDILRAHFTSVSVDLNSIPLLS
jgi:hypothetical protein